MLKNKLMLPLMAGALALGGCDDGSSSPTGASGSARVSLLLTDAPGDLRAAVVTITDIYLQPAEGESAEGEGSARVYLRQGAPVTTDLLTLSNDVLQLVDDRSIPAGEYEQLRFVLSGAYIEVEGRGGKSEFIASPGYDQLPAGATASGRLNLTSTDQSGFKVILKGGTSEENDGAVTLDGDQTLLVDFDVSKSFKRAGNSGQWILRPSLKATSLQSSSSVTVTLALPDSVQLPVLGSAPLTLAGFSATLTPAAGGDAKTVAFTDANNDGTYEATFRYLLPADYRVGLVGPAGITFTTDQALPFAVSAASGTKASVGFQLTSVALAPQAQ